MRIYTAGGGGWGDPLGREIGKVLDDVLDGFVSVESAQGSYGVVTDPLNMTVDQRGTSAMRKDLQSPRGPTKLFHRLNYFDTAEEELAWVERNIPW